MKPETNQQAAHHVTDSSPCLYVVATPIGNLGDMVPRAVEILQSVDCIVAEDTRHSKRLLQHFAIKTPMKAFHEHSREADLEALLQRLQRGETLALITDAGTPLISDPGFPLVRCAHERSIPVLTVPGACAAIAALSVSGLPADRFWFEGFLPAKAGARQKRLQTLSSMQATVIFYEAPHRLLNLFQDMVDCVGGERECCLARELTKQFETVRKGSVAAIRDFIAADTHQQRGECVVLLAPEAASQKHSELDPAAQRVLDILLEELSVKQAASLASKITGQSKRQLYDEALRKKQ